MGEKQFEGEILPGITKVETSGHGGVWLDEKQRAKIPEYLKEHSAGREGIWWEEDSAWSLPILHFGLTRQFGIDERDAESAKDTARDWYPDLYEKMTGEKILPGQSFKRENASRDEQKDDLADAMRARAEHKDRDRGDRER